MSIPDQILFECAYDKHNMLLKSDNDYSILCSIAKKSNEFALEHLDVNKKPIEKFVSDFFSKPKKGLTQKQRAMQLAKQLEKIKQGNLDKVIKESIKDFNPIKLKATDDPDKVKKLSLKDTAFDYFCQYLFKFFNLNVFIDKSPKIQKPKSKNRISLIYFKFEP